MKMKAKNSEIKEDNGKIQNCKERFEQYEKPMCFLF